jgi:predicted membrane channel-forming protein YqfA (hemolysin III family)
MINLLLWWEDSLTTPSVLRNNHYKISERKMKKEQTRQEFKYHLFGWILFIVCAVFFILSSLKNHDTLALVGSIIFLIACFAFIIPLFCSLNKKEDDLPNVKRS